MSTIRNTNGIVNNAFEIDKAVEKRVSYETVNLKTVLINPKQFSKHKISELKRLENLLSESNLNTRYSDIVAEIRKIDRNDLLSYKNEDSEETFIHELLSRPQVDVNEDVLLELFKEFVDNGCDINATDSYSWTCLHYCCVHNYYDLASYIIKHSKFKKENINAKSTKQLKTDTLYYLIGSTPLQICAWLNNLKLAKKLVKHGADIHSKNEAGWTCLHICSRQAHLEFVNFLLDKGARINEGNNHDKTPLHVSSRHGHPHVTEVLLKWHANVALVNNYGQSPLYVAVTRATVDKYLNVIKLLIEYGSDVNQTDKQQNNPLHACAMLKEPNQHKSDVVITTTNYNRNLLNVKIGELLISRNGDASKQNYLGRTPLHYTAKNNCVNFAALLIENAPMSINTRDLYGQTALYIACKWQSAEVGKLLLLKKANKDISDVTGKSPLHLCAQEQQTSTSLITMLLQHGDDVNKALKGNKNDTPLHIASGNNNFQSISYLLEKDADINKVNTEGETPLHIACANGSYETVLELLNSGSKINKTTKQGYTVLHSSILAPKNSNRIASLLIDFGVSINQEDNEKITPLAMATVCGNFGVVNLLIERKAKILNSNHESIAHICAIRNECNSKCLRILISTYRFDPLFDYSLTSYRTPLQSCVEKKSQNFLKALIASDSVDCVDLFRQLHSSKGFGVSPMVMAATTQNYNFIQELIFMWYNKYHETHHSIQKESEKPVNIETSRSTFLKFFTKCCKKKDAPETEREEEEQDTHAIVHGCELCTVSNVCLFKPDWNDPEQNNAKYFLNVLIRENPNLTQEILSTFMKTDILKWETYVYLDHLEPCEDLVNLLNPTNVHERQLTPLETIFIHNKTELVTHPVVKTLIDVKLQEFGKLPLALDILFQISILAIWTAFGCYEDYSVRHSYNRDNMIGKIILLVLCIILFVWEIIEEILQIFYTYRRISGHKRWLKARQNDYQQAFNASARRFSKAPVSMSLDFNSPAKYEKQVSRKKSDRDGLSTIEKEKSKYLLVEKDIRAINSAVSPYARVDNVIDWITVTIQLVTLLTHFIDMGAHDNTKAKAHVCISVINVIVLWLRQLLKVNGLIPGTNLVCMLRLLGSDILRFAFLFIRIYIPFVVLFWTLFGGEKVPESSMNDHWNECEYVNYAVPYTGTYNLNRSIYVNGVDPFNCSTSVAVGGFEDFYNALFSVFRLIVVDSYDFDNMKLIHNVMAPIICSIFLILSAIIGVNFFIGLMSNVLSDGAFNQVESHKSMELLGYVLQKEWRLSITKRQKHLNMIRNQCSPQVLTNNNVVLEQNKSSTTQQIHEQTSGTGQPNLEERLNELQLKFDKEFVQTHEANNEQNENLDSLKTEIRDLKTDLDEIKHMLRQLVK